MAMAQNQNNGIIGHKRKWDSNDVTFLNHSKNKGDNDNHDGEPDKKKRKFKRSDLEPKQKHKVITWMREHPNKSARQVKNHFPIILKDVSEATNLTICYANLTLILSTVTT